MIHPHSKAYLKTLIKSFWYGMTFRQRRAEEILEQFWDAVERYERKDKA